MLRFKFFHLIALVLMTLMATSCSDESTPVEVQPDSDVLLTIHLYENYLDSITEGNFAFVSDSEGTLLDVVTLTDSSTVVFSNTEIHPETVSLTIVQYNDYELSLYTEMGIPAGSEKVFNNSHSDYESGAIDLTFLNPPDCHKYLIANNGGFIGGQNLLPPTRQVHIYRGPTDFFIRIDPDNSDPIGGWLYDLHPGDSDTLDFAQPEATQTLTSNSVQLPSGGDKLFSFLYALDFVNHEKHGICVDYQDYDRDLPESLTLYCPEGRQSNTHSLLSMNFEGPTSYQYIQETRGYIPTAFEKMAGELTIASTSVDSFSFTMTGNWDRSLSQWIQNGNVYGLWIIDGPAPNHAYVLPQLPQGVSDLFPDHPREGFMFHAAEVFRGSLEDGLLQAQRIYPGNGAIDKRSKLPDFFYPQNKFDPRS